MGTWTIGSMIRILAVYFPTLTEGIKGGQKIGQGDGYSMQTASAVNRKPITLAMWIDD